MAFLPAVEALACLDALALALGLEGVDEGVGKDRATLAYGPASVG